MHDGLGDTVLCCTVLNNGVIQCAACDVSPLATVLYMAEMDLNAKHFERLSCIATTSLQYCNVAEPQGELARPGPLS